MMFLWSQTVCYNGGPMRIHRFVLLLFVFAPAFAQAGYGLREYVVDCKKELGQMPPIDCLSGAVIPVFDSDRGVEVTDLNHRGYSQVCDKPSLLHAGGSFGRSHNLNACVPYTRLGIGKAQEGFHTSWVWSC